MDTPTADLDGARIMGLFAMGDELGTEVTKLEIREVGSDGARNLRRWERHKRMKTKIKIKETRWGETRILD